MPVHAGVSADGEARPGMGLAEVRRAHDHRRTTFARIYGECDMEKHLATGARGLGKPLPCRGPSAGGPSWLPVPPPVRLGLLPGVPWRNRRLIP